MRFGLYLLSQGLLTSDELVEGLKKQEESLPPLGQLAIEEGMLSVRDVFRVLRVQADFAVEQFGQTAIDLNLLSRRQVAELLLLQSDRRTPLAEVLVEAGIIDQETINQQLATYRQNLEHSGTHRAIKVTHSIVPSRESESELSAAARGE